MANICELRGKLIAEKPNQIIREGERFYKVSSQSGEGMYDVTRTDKFAMGWICTCPDWIYRQASASIFGLWSSPLPLGTQSSVML